MKRIFILKILFHRDAQRKLRDAQKELIKE